MTKEEIKDIFQKGTEKAENLFAKRLAPRLVILDKLEQEAKELEKKSASQSDAYKEGVQLVLQMISDKREIYNSATSLMRLQLLAPADNSDVDSFVGAINAMMGSIKDLAR